MGLKGCPTVVARALLVAPDAFKGTLSAPQVAAAIGRGVQSAGDSPPDLCPVADGGEGTGEVLRGSLTGHSVEVEVSDPLGRTVAAAFELSGDGRVAVVEVAQASGLWRLAEHERDAEAASSRGTGELIAAALHAGAHTVLVAAGGSATTDGGAGAVEALEQAGGIGDATVVVLCDVRTAFEHAAAVFAPQKGADAQAVARLTRRLHEQAARMACDPRGRPLTGAAGGLSGGLWAAYGARLERGASFVLDALDFDRRLRRARAVVVGEGRLDASTLEGKVAAEISTRARQTGVPAHAVVGSNAMTRFDARILDLQAIIEAGDEAALERAGARLAEIA